MRPEELLRFLALAGRLKTVPRHCTLENGQRESVASHAWRAALMAMLLSAEQPDVDMHRVVELLLVHDLGEAVTGDIPVFDKTARDETVESDALGGIAEMLPGAAGEQLAALFAEWEAGETTEARFAIAIDKIEGVLSHNESDIVTWLPLEYELNQTYGEQQAAAFPFLALLRAQMKRDTVEKIEAAKA